MQTTSDFFHHYQRNHGFEKKEQDIHKEFDRLAIHMKWEENTYFRKLNEFSQLPKNPIEKPKEIPRNNKNSNTYKYFLNFQDFNGFKFDHDNDYYKEFERLADKMKWRENYQYKFNKEKFLKNLTNKPKSKDQQIKKSENQPKFSKIIKENKLFIKKPEYLPQQILLKTDEENAFCNRNSQGFEDLSAIFQKQNGFNNYYHNNMKEENKENFGQKFENEERKDNYEEKWKMEENYDALIQEFSLFN